LRKQVGQKQPWSFSQIRKHTVELETSTTKNTSPIYKLGGNNSRDDSLRKSCQKLFNGMLSKQNALRYSTSNQNAMSPNKVDRTKLVRLTDLPNVGQDGQR